MIVLSIIYPCNFGCPNCPYTDGNSRSGASTTSAGGPAPSRCGGRSPTTCGEYGAWMRCTGGGEPMLHPHMVDMIEYAKARGARVWLNTNGSMFGPIPKLRGKLERILRAGIDLIEFSMDAGDAETYAKVRPPHGGPPRIRSSGGRVRSPRAALDLRRELRAPDLVVSIIRQAAVEGRLDAAVVLAQGGSGSTR